MWYVVRLLIVSYSSRDTETPADEDVVVIIDGLRQFVCISLMPASRGSYTQQTAWALVVCGYPLSIIQSFNPVEQGLYQGTPGV